MTCLSDLYKFGAENYCYQCKYYNEKRYVAVQDGYPKRQKFRYQSHCMANPGGQIIEDKFNPACRHFLPVPIEDAGTFVDTTIPEPDEVIVYDLDDRACRNDLLLVEPDRYELQEYIEWLNRLGIVWDHADIPTKNLRIRPDGQITTMAGTPPDWEE